MKKYVKYSSLIFASVLLSYSTANAAAISVSSDVSLKTTANTNNVQSDTSLKASVNTKNMQSDIEMKRSKIIDTIRDNRKSFISELNAKRDSFKIKVEAEKKKLHQDLIKIKDEGKRTTVENINTKIHDLNIKVTDQFSSTVNRIDTVFANIQARLSIATSKGIDVSSVDQNNAKAIAAIADARAAISVQASKVYTISVTNDATLKASVKKVRDAFESDLKAVNKKVEAASKAVKDSSVALSKIPNIDADSAINTQVEATTNTNKY